MDKGQKAKSFTRLSGSVAHSGVKGEEVKLLTYPKGSFILLYNAAKEIWRKCMAREKHKKKRRPQNFTGKMLRDINSTKLAGSELMEYGEEIHRLKPKDRDFEGRAITAIRFFANSDRAMSAMFRMEALARIITQGRLEGWRKPGDKKGMSLTNPILFEAAGQVPLRIIKNKFEFSRATLLKKVFQIGKLQNK